MRRRHRARLLRLPALGLAAAFPAPASRAAVLGSRRRTLLPGPASATAGAGGGVVPTQAPVGAGGGLRPAPRAATAARSARLVSTPAVA